MQVHALVCVCVCVCVCVREWCKHFISVEWIVDNGQQKRQNRSDDWDTPKSLPKKHTLHPALVHCFKLVELNTKNYYVRTNILSV